MRPARTEATRLPANGSTGQVAFAGLVLSLGVAACAGHAGLARGTASTLEAAPATAVCAASASGDARLIERRYSPKRFARGEDPSQDPACRNVPNPERGFFAFRDLLAPADLDELRGEGVTLIYGQVLLAAYRDRPLDQAILARIREGFAGARRAGVKVLPRFYYAADDKAADARPARALEHIAALAPLLRENADVIAALHAGFVGAWGEWHPETRASLPERKQIVEALLTALPPDRTVLLRRPFYKQALFGAAQPATQQRIGHLNDCFLASPNDAGTYRTPAEATFAISDSASVAVGGETCAVNPPRSECPTALAELEHHHWSFLNRDYHSDVLAGWRTGGCWDTVACRLGYRLLVVGTTQPKVARVGEALSVRITFSNDGYARPVNPRPVSLVLLPSSLSEATNAARLPVVLPTGYDARQIAPGPDRDVCLSASLPTDLRPGIYRVGLALPDPAPALQGDARYAVELGGGVMWDAPAGVNWLEAPITVTR